MRVGETRHRWEFQLQDAEAAGHFATVGDLIPLIAPWVESVPHEELELLRVAEYTFRAAVANQWRRRNVFLLGDAAHLAPPFIGQGMGAGLRDAANLAWKLAGVIGGHSPASLLDTYEAERKPHAGAMTRLARVTGALMTGGGRWGNALRRVSGGALARVPDLGSPIIEGVTPPLRRPPDLRVRTRDRLTGRLVPNALVDGVALDKLSRGHWVLISVDAVDAGDRDVLESHGCIVARTSDGRLCEWLRWGRSKAALVRPDRTVYLSDPDADAVVAAAAVDILVKGPL